jgi:hypothetical protein
MPRSPSNIHTPLSQLQSASGQSPRGQWLAEYSGWLNMDELTYSNVGATAVGSTAANEMPCGGR